MRIWDQSIMDGTPPEGILYGAEYKQEDINRALSGENPYDIVPSRDEDGHGTFLAGVACGGEDIANDFIGAAPEATIAVVKLKEAKPYLREFYFVPEGVPVYQENDIMMAVSYLNRLAMLYDMPLVLCIGLGSSMGSHGRGGTLSAYLNYIARRRKRVVVVAAGNEANTRHHYRGQIAQGVEYEDVEISVEEDMKGFFVELWTSAPELYAVAVISPTGELLPKIPVRMGVSASFDFVFERTTVVVDYRMESQEMGRQLIFFRFINAKRGIWTIRVYPQNTVTGIYHMWLPIKELSSGDVFFLRSNPDVTLTTPSTALEMITVGGYNALNQSIYLDSGRGYTVLEDIKPDFAAPAVNVYGPGLRGNYTTYTGTSPAAAITAGACAQIMQWAIVDRNNPTMSAAGIKNMLIRGAIRPNDRLFPNREWGYGILDVYNAFDVLRTS